MVEERGTGTLRLPQPLWAGPSSFAPEDSRGPAAQGAGMLPGPAGLGLGTLF